MAITVSPLGLSALVELVNGWGTSPRREGGRREDLLPSAKTLPDQELPEGVRSGAMEEEVLVNAADALYRVFAADDAATCARRLTRILSASGARPTLETAGADGTLRAAWVVGSADRGLVAAGAIALRQHLAEQGFARIGVCTGGRCVDVYIDHSPGGRRRFCSVTCQNRARVAAFRERRAATAAE